MPIMHTAVFNCSLYYIYWAAK